MFSSPHIFPQLKAKSGHNGEGLLLPSPPVSDSPSMPAQGGIMAPVALRAAYPGSELSDPGLNSILVPQGMIPTLDEQPEENDDVEDGIVLAQACEMNYQVHHQTGNIMHAHGGHDAVQSQYAMQGMGMMGMMAPPTVVMSYTAPLRPRGMPSQVMPLPHGMSHPVPMHGQYMGINGMSMASNVPRDIRDMQNGSLLADDSIRCQHGFMGLNDDLVRSHSPGLVNSINFFADDPQ